MRDDAHEPKVSGAGIAYDVTGTGPPVLFVHGLRFDSRTWAPIVRRLGDAVTSLVVDLPGHCSSSSWPSYDIDEVVDALHTTVTEVGLSPPVAAHRELTRCVRADGARSVTADPNGSGRRQAAGTSRRRRGAVE